jgi:hypothetical protein
MKWVIQNYFEEKESSLDSSDLIAVTILEFTLYREKKGIQIMQYFEE